MKILEDQGNPSSDPPSDSSDNQHGIKLQFKQVLISYQKDPT